MKSQEQRDEEAVTIVAGLLLFMLVTTAGAVVLVLARHIGALNSDVMNVLVYAVLGCAVVASTGYIYHHRDR